MSWSWSLFFDSHQNARNGSAPCAKLPSSDSSACSVPDRNLQARTTRRAARDRVALRSPGGVRRAWQLATLRRCRFREARVSGRAPQCGRRGRAIGSTRRAHAASCRRFVIIVPRSNFKGQQYQVARSPSSCGRSQTPTASDMSRLARIESGGRLIRCSAATSSITTPSGWACTSCNGSCPHPVGLSLR